jgi:pimeloyl-ACP methyl ester carboxylesterase
MATFLLVPGAWLGGWCFHEVAARLRVAGNEVVPATLTGLGERSHLLTPEIDLATHVADVEAMLRYRDMRDVLLVGHSYGGTVITQVAEQVADRLRGLIYLDASVPDDGCSNNDVVGAEMAARLRASAVSDGDGWRVPPADHVATRMTGALREWLAARLTPHPLPCFEDRTSLHSAAAAALPRAFIRTTHSELYDRLLAKARARGWHCQDLSGGHYAMLTEPDAMAAALATAARALDA